MKTAIGVSSQGSNRLDIFSLGTDNQMYHKAWDGSEWLPSSTDWEPLGEILMTVNAHETISWEQKVKGGEYMACVNLTKKQIKILEEAGEEVELAEARLEGKKNLLSRADLCGTCC